MRAGYSIAFLVAGNLLPLFGVLLWDWDVFLLLLLFWFENVVIGLFGIARIVVSRSHQQFQGGMFLPLFFLMHYGGFMFGHFMVLFAFYSDNATGTGVPVVPTDYLDIMLQNLNWVALLALLVAPQKAGRDASVRHSQRPLTVPGGTLTGLSCAHRGSRQRLRARDRAVSR